MAVLSAVLVWAIQGMSPTRDEQHRLLEAGPLGVTELQIGDCVLVDPGSEKLQGMAAVPCVRHHDAQVYATGFLDQGDYPGDGAVIDMVEGKCADAMDLNVRDDDSEYTIVTLRPTPETWTTGRGYTCLVERRDGRRMTGDVPWAAAPA